MYKVVIIQEMIKQYREPFYHELYSLLKKDDICLQIIYSEPKLNDKLKSDNVILPDEYSKSVRCHRWLGGKLVYQCCLREIFSADIVVVEQANKHIVNYLLIVLSIFKLKRFAFWGHGRNLQSRPDAWKEKIKKMLITQPDWWFAYTLATRDYVHSQGYPLDSITNVENSIDVRDFRQEVYALTDDDKKAYRDSLFISESDIVGIYCGSMYPEKCIDMLLESMSIVKGKLDNFQLIIVGSGVEKYKVERFCEHNPWVHYMGALFDSDKAKAFSVSDILINPGLVGLSVLDGFAAGIPMATTNYPYHSPEIDYLNEENGLVTPHNARKYADGVLELLKNNERLSQMKNAAVDSSFHYSIENMARNFYRGIKAFI